MKKSKKNIIDDWLKEYGDELARGWFEKTTGCVQDVSKFTEHENDK